MGETEHLPEELVAYAVNLPWQATFTRGEVQDLVLGVPTAPVVPDRAVEERERCESEAARIVAEQVARVGGHDHITAARHRRAVAARHATRTGVSDE